MRFIRSVTAVSPIVIVGFAVAMTMQTAHSQEQGIPPVGKGVERQENPSTATALLPKDVTRVPVVFSDGHDTDPRDGGRPVILIAAALGVTPDVFRDAFSHVHPARAGSEPAPEQVRANKAVLLNALGKYGITNDRIDTVSNYYRYVRSRNEHWLSSPAIANALVKGSVVIGYEVLSGGSGYSSPPTVSVPNLRGAQGFVRLAFSKRLESNGAIAAITVSKDNVSKNNMKSPSSARRDTE